MQEDSKTKGPALRRKGVSEVEAKAAAAVLGSVKSERKAATSAANGFKPGNQIGGRKQIPLDKLDCPCGLAGDALAGHKWNCPRGQAIKRRIKAGKL